MFTRIWSTRHGARQIRLEYDWSLTSFKRRARLLTDGKEIANWQGSALDGPNAVLSVGRLQAKIAPRGLFAGAQILLDGQRIGGDAWINEVSREKARDYVMMPFAEFVLKRGLLLFGLPFALLQMLILTVFGLQLFGQGIAVNLGVTLIEAAAFAVVMSWQVRKVYAGIAGMGHPVAGDRTVPR